MDLFYQTQNAALALTLVTCGVERPRNEKGELIPCENRYDSTILRNLGYGGWEMESAVADAVKKGKKGIVTYNFVPSELQRQICVAWEKKEESLRAKDKNARVYELGEEIPDIPPFLLAQICCQLLKNRTRFLEEWKEVRPLLVFHGPTSKEPNANGGWTVKGSFKARSLHASKHIRERLKETIK